jgi:4-hydroxybenzoate polyprenyltransferase
MKQQLINFLKIIRWKNVVIYALLQVLLYFVFFKQTFQFHNGWFFLTLTMIFYGIFGNIQNNLADYELDSHKNDFIPFNKTAYTIILILLLIFALIFSFASFYLTFHPTLLYAVLLVPVLLSGYNYFLKKTPLIGNLIIAFLTAFAIFIPINYALSDINFTKEQNELFRFLLILAFLLTLLREIAKDMEDKHIDKAFGYKTLPVIHTGLSKIIFILFSLILAGTVWLLRNSITDDINFYLLSGLILFCLIFSIKSIYDNKYKTATQILKLSMVIGYIILIFSQF